MQCKHLVKVKLYIVIRGQTMYHSVFYNIKGAPCSISLSTKRTWTNLKNVEDPWVSTGKEMLRCLTPCVLVLEIQDRLFLKDTSKEPHVRCEPKMWTQNKHTQFEKGHRNLPWHVEKTSRMSCLRSHQEASLTTLDSQDALPQNGSSDSRTQAS